MGLVKTKSFYSGEKDTEAAELPCQHASLSYSGRFPAESGICGLCKYLLPPVTCHVLAGCARPPRLDNGSSKWT